MSEADSPNDPAASASIDPLEQSPAVQIAAEAVEPTEEEGWQTVDFPGAMSIDALPQSQVLPPASLITFGEAIESGVIHYSSAELDPATAPLTMAPPEIPKADSQLQHLQEENAALRDRLAQAELDLVQHQIEWQLESACSQANVTTSGMIEPAAEMQHLPVELTHARLHQLLQELERSQQTAQRQQILVETLTEQLESSQERIAQLERDCALTQQRHNEQVQQVLQAESACRDLRLRLHRQQQQTLQFKAALEKCLEMPTVYSQQLLPETVIDDSMSAPHPLSALFKPKTQPVKPWSQPSETAQANSDQPVLPKPLFKLLNHSGAEQTNADGWQEGDALTTDSFFCEEKQEQTIADSTPSSTLLDSDDPQFVAQLMQLMFPDTAEGHTYSDPSALEADVSQAESIFDLSPFLAAPPTETLPSVDDDQQVSAPIASEATVSAPLSLPASPSADRLWHDLSALIDPASTGSSTEAISTRKDALTDAPETESPSPITPERGGIPPLSTMPHAALPSAAMPVTAASESIAASDRSIQPLNAWTWRDRVSRSNKATLVPRAEQASTEDTDADETNTANLDTGSVVAARTAQHPSKLLALSTLDQRSTVKQTVSVSSQTKPAPVSFATATPSPIVYPLRSSKKLTSLAAVDLPTFPRP